MNWYVDDRVYYLLPYGSSQTLIYSWADALKLAAQLPNECMTHEGLIYVWCCWQSNYTLPKDRRDMLAVKIPIDLKQLRRAQGYFTGY